MNRRLWRIGMLTAAGMAASLFFSASVLFARQGVVKTRDGRTLEGDIEEKPDVVTVSMHGIRTNIDRDQLAGQVEYFDNVQDRYQAKLKALPRNAAAADHLALARWCYDVKLYDQALEQIEEARKVDPNNAEAGTLEQTVISQRRIEKNRTGGAAAAGTGTGAAPKNGGNTGANTAAAGDRGAPGRVLTADDINAIRQMEWRENDSVAPRAVVPADVRKRYIEMTATPAAQFATYNQTQQAYIILSDAKTPPDMRKQIKLTTDPQALAEYRRVIQPLILNNCATIGCHGGKNAGDFQLLTNNPEREDVAYTNFYILQNYIHDFNGQQYSMIDRTYPDRSILAEFALAQDVADLRHPKLKGQTYKPMAVSKASPTYVTIVTGIKNLRANDPNYGINYKLPGGAKSKLDSDAAPKPTDAPKPAAAPTGTGTTPQQPAAPGDRRPRTGTGGAPAGQGAQPQSKPPVNLNK
ncbi:MAG TPA: hypothetical protein VH475_10730 [Tepidisphaeraceae bacterium]|jgi:tetratricopeptide (TPR) repeat protein